MKVLFEFSRRGIPEHLSTFHQIRDYILDHGHKLTNDLVEDSKQTQDFLPENVFFILQRAISESNCSIIEGSEVSMSLGYVLTEAISLGKPVLFLVKSDSVNQANRFVSSIKSKLLTISIYANPQELNTALDKFFQKNAFIKTRFNLVLPNDLNSFITQKSLAENISKTEYILRKLNELMEKDEQQS